MLSKSRPERTSQSGLLVVFAIAVVVVLYIASAAPATAAIGEVHDAYRPVIWLMYNTPLGPPLRWWVRVWDVEIEFFILASPKARQISESLGHQ